MLTTRYPYSVSLDVPFFESRLVQTNDSFQEMAEMVETAEMGLKRLSNNELLSALFGPNLPIETDAKEVTMGSKRPVDLMDQAAVSAD